MSSNHYRKIAFEAHGKKCDVCGAEEDIDVHHRDGDRKNNDPDNLLPLCVTCHKKVHNGMFPKLANELLPTSERNHIIERNKKEKEEYRQSREREKITYPALDLRQRQVILLRIVWSHGPGSGSDIKTPTKNAVGKERYHHSEFYTNLDGLAEAGYISKEKNGRENIYEITDEGKRLLWDISSWLLEDC